jgi:hypothetical protein
MHEIVFVIFLSANLYTQPRNVIVVLHNERCTRLSLSLCQGGSYIRLHSTLIPMDVLNENYLLLVCGAV